MSEMIIPRISNGTEFMLWFDGQCDGCSRHGLEECRCPLEASILMGAIKKSMAVRMGFDEKGNPPKKLKCWRKYMPKKKESLSGELF